jgi:hypothetical protein
MILYHPYMPGHTPSLLAGGAAYFDENLAGLIVHPALMKILGMPLYTSERME